MGELMTILLASGSTGAVVGVIALMINVVFIKKYIEKLEDELQKKTLAEIETLKKTIDDKASRSRVVETERRLKAIEDVGLNHVWREQMTAQFTKIFEKLDMLVGDVAKLSTVPAQMTKIEDKLDRHIENDK